MRPLRLMGKVPRLMGKVLRLMGKVLRPLSPHPRRAAPPLRRRQIPAMRPRRSPRRRRNNVRISWGQADVGVPLDPREIALIRVIPPFSAGGGAGDPLGIRPERLASITIGNTTTRQRKTKAGLLALRGHISWMGSQLGHAANAVILTLSHADGAGPEATRETWLVSPWFEELRHGLDNLRMIPAMTCGWPEPTGIRGGGRECP